MIKSKISLADLLIVFGALGFGFFCFLSINFLTLGDTTQSIIQASIISLTLGGLAFGLKLVKRTSGKFKTYIIVEWVLIILFLIVAVLEVSPFSHYFVVSAQKDNIQNKVVANINRAEELFLAYENYADTRLSMYKSRLNSIVAAKAVNRGDYDSFGFVNGLDDNTQVASKMLILKAQLYPSNYSEMKQIDSTWLSNAKDDIKNWSPLGIVTVVNSLDGQVSLWIKQLNSNSKFRAKGESQLINDFNFRISFDQVSFIFKMNSKPILLSLSNIILFLLLLSLLISYFNTERHSKNIYTLFGKRKVERDNNIDVEF